MSFLLQDCEHLKPRDCEALKGFRHYNVGLEDPEFRNFTGIFSNRLFDRFHQFAEENLKRGMPLLIAGGGVGLTAIGTLSGRILVCSAMCSSPQSLTIRVQRLVQPSTRSFILPATQR